MKVGREAAWTTEKEMRFIDVIGGVTLNCKPWSDRRIKYLERYIEASAQRVNWGEMDRKVVLEYAEWRLKEARNGKTGAGEKGAEKEVVENV